MPVYRKATPGDVMAANGEKSVMGLLFVSYSRGAVTVEKQLQLRRAYLS